MKYHFPFPPRTLRCDVGFNAIICPSVQGEQENMISHLRWALRVIFWRAVSTLLLGSVPVPFQQSSFPAPVPCQWCVFITHQSQPKISTMIIVCPGESTQSFLTPVLSWVGFLLLASQPLV